MSVGALVRRAWSVLRAKRRTWDEKSRQKAVERTLYRASGGGTYPSREAAQYRHPADGGGADAGAGGGDGGA